VIVSFAIYVCDVIEAMLVNGSSFVYGYVCACKPDKGGLDIIHVYGVIVIDWKSLLELEL
jgi:hypothetical protein